MVRAEDVNINIEEMKIIEMPLKNAVKMTVTVNEQGFLTFSPSLLKALHAMYPSLKIEFRCSDDARIIVFREPQKYQFTIFKTGRFRHIDFMMNLKGHGYKFPAKYAVAWNEGLKAWVGVLQKIEKAPSVKNLVRNKTCRRQ